MAALLFCGDHPDQAQADQMGAGRQRLNRSNVGKFRYGQPPPVQHGGARKLAYGSGNFGLHRSIPAKFGPIPAGTTARCFHLPLRSSKVRPFFGSHVVAATSLGWGGGFYGVPVFLYAVVARTAWSVAMAPSAKTVHFLLGAGIVATLRRLYQRFGVPLVTLTKAALLALGNSRLALAASLGSCFYRHWPTARAGSDGTPQP